MITIIGVNLAENSKYILTFLYWNSKATRTEKKKNKNRNKTKLLSFYQIDGCQICGSQNGIKFERFAFFSQKIRRPQGKKKLEREYIHSPTVHFS